MVYFIVAFTLFLFSLIADSGKLNRKQTHILFFFSVSFLVLFEGLRWEIGTDWEPYYDYFMSLDNEHNEKGYYIIIKTIRSFTSSFTIYLLLQAIFFYTVFSTFIKKYSINPLLSLCLLFCIFLPFWGCNRQFIAIALSIYSLRFVFDRKLLLFTLSIIIATSIHTSAILFFPVYFLSDTKYNGVFIIVLTGVAFVIGAMGLLNNIPYLNFLALMDDSSGEKMASYLGKDISGSFSIPGAFRRLLIVFGGLMIKNKVNDKKFDFFLLVYTIGTVIYLLFISTQLQLVAGRGAMYFTVMEIILVPLIINKITRNKGLQLLIWTGYFIILLYLLNRDINYYFLMDGVDIFRPYKTILG